MFEIIQLSNGKRVGNFNIMTDLQFEDGNILPKVTEPSEDMIPEYDWKEIFSPLLPGDLKYEVKLTPRLNSIQVHWLTMQEKGKVDVVFCTSTALQAMEQQMGPEWMKRVPFRGLWFVDGQKISIEKQRLV